MGLKISVLIVDNNQIFLSILKNHLENSDIFDRIFTANNVKNASDILYKEKNIGVILLDLIMPGVNGLDAIPKFIEINQNANIVIMSNNSLIQYEKAAMERGAKAYLHKSNLYQELVPLIQTITG